ncbi:hypothetical protein ACE4RU_05075 [Actinobacillus seminis]|uniref:hypothetical protein n=1 Tax=Actinobacillus seminis TaxID=722 RepID=UPI003B9242D9
MYALDNDSGVQTMPEVKTKKFNHTEPRWFTEGGNGVAPSYPGADWFNIVQAELLGVLTAGGIEPSKTNLNQLTQAIQQVVQNKVNTAVNGKADTQHRHAMSDVSGLSDALGAKAPLASPALTGTPTAPTASQATNNTQIATTAFVKAAIAALVGSAPAALDTLQELANALGQDANFRNTVLNQIAGKANQSHTHSYSQISDFANGVASQFSYKKTRNFEIFKYPDGSMTQIYRSNPVLNHGNNVLGFTFNWAQAFVSTPALSGSIYSDLDEARDCWITFNKSGTTNAKVKYWLFEGSYNANNLQVNIIGIGRWK